MNLKDLLIGGALGALISLGVEFVHYSKPKPVPSVPQVATPAQPKTAVPAQPIEDRLRKHDAQAAWLNRRDLEFDKCAALHGTPTLGFGMRVVCLDSHAVKFLGEQHPPDE